MVAEATCTYLEERVERERESTYSVVVFYREEKNMYYLDSTEYGVVLRREEYSVEG